ncbi:MAG: SoxR reducing system RseC family protein [Zoogloeaceae bacterium]|nr:SoxR reducing system RseC family protein [Zoogloeaceae bacterium]
MIEARAVVVGVAGGLARVRVIDRQEGCGRCDEPGGCRSVKLAYAVRPPASEFSLPDTLGVQVGEEVALQMRDGASLRGALTSYGLGAVLMILCAAGGQLLASAAMADAWAVAGAAGGLAAAWVVNRVLHRSRRWRGGLRVEMSRPGAVCAHDFGDLR